ncbi:hypothetical protein QWZ13_03925 [Reinekea marina]|uniref:DUF3592 domain-containing protein n=1 Tax=Reinekea marina TaxID=1310421 RepID=A0ABV7WR85_9GAMM|nr:hypothetical protein [Reinekea marina]MDN3648050.1 hypothetical protein [Reinekea marina]
MTLAFTITCVLLIIQAAIYLLLNAWTKYWPTVSIKDLTVSTHTKPSDIRSGSTIYTIGAVYSYVVDGVEVRSNRIGLAKRIRTENLSEFKRVKQRLEASKTVHYCPFHHRFSMLSTDTFNKAFTYFSLIVGAFLLAIVKFMVHILN